MDLKDEFKTILRSDESSQDIADRYILNGEAWVFADKFSDQSATRYEEFKRIIGRSVDLHSSECRLVGSAKSGISLSPKKNFRKFHKKSDLDVVLVSAPLFDKIWKEYLVLDYRVKGLVDGYARFGFYRQFATVKLSKKLRETTPELKKIYQLFGGIQARVDGEFNLNHEITFRIYRSWLAADLYHTENINKLRSELEKK